MFGISGKKRKIKTKRKRKRRGKRFPIGLLASAAAPFLGEIVEPIFTIFGKGKRKRR